MEIRYKIVLILGAIVVVALIALLFVKGKKRKFTEGKKAAGTSSVAETKYYKARLMQYKIYCAIVLGCMIVAITSAFVLLSRPYKSKDIQEEEYKRDIILCIDVSSSVDELNRNLIKELKDTVKDLNGERFGIVIFNTSPVLIVPLTDDYEVVLESLDMLETALSDRVYDEETGSMDFSNSDWLYYSQYIIEGTQIGWEERGSSLIGDGLASSIFNFSELDQKRTRIVIFSTDNDLEGTPIVTIQEAANMCKEHNVTVFGIGTKEMYSEDMNSMKKAMETTGGKFFLEEASGTFKEIVDSIEQESKNLVKGSHRVQKIDRPRGAFVVLLLSVFAVMLFAKILKK